MGKLNEFWGVVKDEDKSITTENTVPFGDDKFTDEKQIIFALFMPLRLK